jgi:Spy/CpxP family protein refolding chaperone
LGTSLILSAPSLLAQNTATDSGPVVSPRFHATTPAPQTQSAATRSQNLADALNLTADQRAKFDAEMKDFQDKMKALQDAHDKKLAEFLTADQAAKLKTFQQNRGPGGPRGFGGPGGGFGRGGGFGPDPQQMVQMMKSQLNLTTDQESKITQILQDSQTKMEALRNSASAGGNRQAMFSQMMSLNQDRMSKINAVLTDEQRAKFQAMQPQRGRGFGPGAPGGPPPGFGPGGPGGPPPVDF